MRHTQKQRSMWSVTMNDKIKEARVYLQAISDALQELDKLRIDILNNNPSHAEMELYRRIKAPVEKIKSVL